MILPSDLELSGDWGKLSKDEELPWSVRAVVISGERSACRTGTFARLEDLFLPSALVSGRKEGFSGAPEELRLILAV